MSAKLLTLFLNEGFNIILANTIEDAASAISVSIFVPEQTY